MNKRALSEVVGYVLLVAMAIALSAVVYYFINSYLPKQTSNCPDGVSIIINDYKCDNINNLLNLTMQNKGLFDIDGFILKASNDSNMPAKTLDYINSSGGTSSGIVYFDKNFDLVMKPNEKYNQTFNYSEHGMINKIQIIPFKLYKGESLICGKAQITQRMEGCN